MMRYLLTTLGVLFVGLFLGCAVLAAYTFAAQAWVAFVLTAAMSAGSLKLAATIDTRLES